MDKIRQKGRVQDQHDARRRRQLHKRRGGIDMLVGPLQESVLGRHIEPLLPKSMVLCDRPGLVLSVQTVFRWSSSAAAATEAAASAVTLVFLFAAV